MTSYLNSRGITSDTISQFQLGYSGDTGNTPTRNRLTIPYLTPAGPLHIKYRCVSCHGKCEGHSKYTYDTGAQLHLYNAQTLLDADQVVVTEGEIDAITVEQLGLPAVAYPGTQAWSANKHWRWCFDSVRDVIVLADGDDPGRKAAKLVYESLTNAGVEARVVNLPDGEDSNSFILQAEDPDDFRTYVGVE